MMTLSCLFENMATIASEEVSSHLNQKSLKEDLIYVQAASNRLGDAAC